MISESYYWKEDLLKTAVKLKKRLKQKRWPLSSFLSFEKEMFFSFYAIRKLIEAQKLSPDLIESKIAAFSYPSTGRNVNIFNSHKLDKLYDIEIQKIEDLDISFVCNQIIHSYIYEPFFDENELLSGILFASDRQRHKNLFGIYISNVIALLERVGSDYPENFMMIYDEKKKDYIMKKIEQE